MSYEKVLCGSPESDSTEEPPPSLYSVELEEPGLRLKKKQLAENQRPLAETVNIEDQIMNDDEIARVNSAAGESKSRRNFEESDARRKFEKSASGNKKNFGCETDDRRWIDLNLRNTGGTGIPSAFELDGRESVIKRRKLASDSDESRKKDDGLQCDESMAEEISRPIYEGYGSADLPQSKEKTFINTQKLYTSTLHRNTASPSSSSDDHKSNASPGLRSDHGSPRQSTTWKTKAQPCRKAEGNPNPLVEGRR